MGRAQDCESLALGQAVPHHAGDLKSISQDFTLLIWKIVIIMASPLHRTVRKKKNVISAVHVLLKLKKKKVQWEGKGLFFLSRLINMGCYPEKA